MHKSLNLGVKKTSTNSIEYDLNKNIVFRIYPNPSRGEIYVLSLKPELQKFEISIVNQIGTLVQRMNFHGENMAKLDLSQLPNGLYFVTIKSEYGTYSSRVIKMNDIISQK